MSATREAVTGIVGLRRNIAQELNKVGKIFSHELEPQNEILARVVGERLSPEQLCLARYPQCRSLGGVLSSLSAHILAERVEMTLVRTLKANFSRPSANPGSIW